MADMNEVIEDAINDIEVPETEATTEVEASADSSTEATPEATGPAPETTETPADAAPGTENAPEPDKFAKEFGLTAQSVTGRENRIPYSRVKAIVDKAQKKATEPLTAKLTEFETKVTDYERRLEQVGQFEQIMVNDPQRFLQMLSTLPAYKPVFEALLNPGAGSQQGQQSQEDPGNGMPQPNQKLPDGTMVYDMDGLKALMAWQAQQVEQRVSQRYQPIEEAWRSQEHINQIIPVVQRQVEEARTWPMFKENEEAIVVALQRDQNLSLERAYQQVVFPKLAGNRDQIRQEVLKEIKSAPGGSTSAPTRSSRPGAQTSNSPRSTFDVVAEAVKGLR